MFRMKDETNKKDGLGHMAIKDYGEEEEENNSYLVADDESSNAGTMGARRGEDDEDNDDENDDDEEDIDDDDGDEEDETKSPSVASADGDVTASPASTTWTTYSEASSPDPSTKKRARRKPVIPPSARRGRAPAVAGLTIPFRTVKKVRFGRIDRIEWKSLVNLTINIGLILAGNEIGPRQHHSAERGSDHDDDGCGDVSQEVSKSKSENVQNERAKHY